MRQDKRHHFTKKSRMQKTEETFLCLNTVIILIYFVQWS